MSLAVLPYGRLLSSTIPIMKKAFDFLKTHKEVAFATVEGNKPQIRVFQIMKQQDRTLYFATSFRKKVYLQLKQNPNVELLAMEGNISVRLRGQAHFDVNDSMSKEIYASNPVLSRLYSSYDELAYFRLPISELDYYDLTPTPPVLEHYNYEQE